MCVEIISASGHLNGRDFRRRPRFSPAAEIFAEGQDFRQRPRFSPAAEIFTDADFRTQLGHVGVRLFSVLEGLAERIPPSRSAGSGPSGERQPPRKL